MSTTIESAANTSQTLADLFESLSMATTVPEITQAVARAARAVAHADGASFVLREPGVCYYADEHAISPLWKGMRFPAEICISGWAMTYKQIVKIHDISRDLRIPQGAYKPTFVKSLCMVPIRLDDPIGAIGIYWAREYDPSDEEVRLLKIISNSTAVALENIDLKQEISRRSSTQATTQASEGRELELAIHSIVHDLKSPLFTMVSCAELLRLRLEGKLDSSSVGFFDLIKTTGLQAGHQIERLLALSRARDFRLEKQAIDLSQLVYDISEKLLQQGQGRQIDVEIEPGLRAYGDPALLRVALENLMSNAFKFTSKKPSAKITVKKAGQELGLQTFMVQDNGAGFDNAAAEKLFRPLVRLHDAQDFPGQGLGLASVGRIIEIHGGRVRAEGQKAQGSTFYFSLPSTAGV